MKHSMGTTRRLTVAMAAGLLAVAGLSSAGAPSAGSQVVRLNVSRRRGARGSVTLVRVQVDAPAATVLLQSKASPSSPWKTARRARLSATGTGTFTLGASVHGRLRALVSPAGGGPQLRSSAVAARA